MAAPIDYTERETNPANWTREKELAYWNRPYVFKAYPKMLYRCTTTAGRITQEQRIVGSEADERLALGAGWLANPQAATEAEARRQEALGTAAAERAFTDRKMSRLAQVEADEADSVTARHLGAIPEKPVPRSHKKQAVAPPAVPVTAE